MFRAFLRVVKEKDVKRGCQNLQWVARGGNPLRAVFNVLITFQSGKNLTKIYDDLTLIAVESDKKCIKPSTYLNCFVFYDVLTCTHVYIKT